MRLGLLRVEILGSAEEEHVRFWGYGSAAKAGEAVTVAVAVRSERELRKRRSEQASVPWTS